jgi:hypothetical protein
MLNLPLPGNAQNPVLTLCHNSSATAVQLAGRLQAPKVLVGVHRLDAR